MSCGWFRRSVLSMQSWAVWIVVRPPCRIAVGLGCIDRSGYAGQEAPPSNVIQLASAGIRHLKSFASQHTVGRVSDPNVCSIAGDGCGSSRRDANVVSRSHLVCVAPRRWGSWGSLLLQTFGSLRDRDMLSIRMLTVDLLPLALTE